MHAHENDCKQQLRTDLYIHQLLQSGNLWFWSVDLHTSEQSLWLAWETNKQKFTNYRTIPIFTLHTSQVILQYRDMCSLILSSLMPEHLVTLGNQFTAVHFFIIACDAV